MIFVKSQKLEILTGSERKIRPLLAAGGMLCRQTVAGVFAFGAAQPKSGNGGGRGAGGAQLGWVNSSVGIEI
ncbi:hypothetical protein [Kamptonema formosum]|uniref:hypothetical protein n=1 Tax=Kamptonema formosum TaxID=331992 RepID=UPI000348AA26|nr:hypothetical protein [Oscillatoria sp. PCC 10802]